MLNSIGNMALVRCREVVRFSEGPLSEARLYPTILCNLSATITIIHDKINSNLPYKGHKLVLSSVSHQTPSSQQILYSP